MNNIWLILFLLAGFGQSDGCHKQPGCGCVQGSKNCEKNKVIVEAKKNIALIRCRRFRSRGMTTDRVAAVKCRKCRKMNKWLNKIFDT